MKVTKKQLQHYLKKLLNEAFQTNSSIIPDTGFINFSTTPLNKSMTKETINIEERRLLTQKVMRYQHSLSPAIFLYETARFDALSSKVNGFNISVGHINYDEISFDN